MKFSATWKHSLIINSSDDAQSRSTYIMHDDYRGLEEGVKGICEPDQATFFW